jgi:hypothetical protein
MLNTKKCRLEIMSKIRNTEWDIISNKKYQNINEYYLLFSIRRFVLFDVLSHSAFFPFDVLSHSTFLTIRPFVQVDVFSIRCFVPFGVLSHSTFCPIRRFVPFGVLSFDVLSFDVFYSRRFFYFRHSSHSCLTHPA